MLPKTLEFVQQKMLLRFEEIRSQFQHPGNKGSNVEQIVREFLREFLPPYMRVGQGEIVDLPGNVSRQMDVVITNEYHPYLNDLATPSQFIVEGVACVAEVKSVLTSSELQRALENSLSFKRLSINMPRGMMAQGNREDLTRFVNKRPSFLFAFESQLAIATIKERILEWNAANKLPVQMQLDAVFILSGGSLINFGEGGGTLQMIDPIKKTGMAGYFFREAAKDRPLVSLLSWLSASTPRFTLPHAPVLNYLIV